MPRSPLSAAALLPLLLALATSGSQVASADDGDLDPDFGTSGRALAGLGFAQAVLARADGSLRLGISRFGQVAFLALEPDGHLDTSFGEGGIRTVVPDPNSESSNPVAIFERPDGRLLMVADVRGSERAALIQVTAEGELDESFGPGGVHEVRYAAGDWTSVKAAVLLGNGKILVAGNCLDCGPSVSSDTMLARFGENGLIDTTFGDNGWVFFDAYEGGTDYDYATAVAFDTNGKILIAGAAGQNAGRHPYVARRLANGGVDILFGGGDGLLTLSSMSSTLATSLAVDPVSKRILVATGGASFPSVLAQQAVVRVTASGNLDDEFGDGGFVPLDFEDGSTIRQIRLQSDRKIVGVGSVDALGDQQEGFLLVRLLPGGTLDSSFDGNGRKHVEFDLQPNARDYAVAMTLSGGRLVAVGTAMDGPAGNVAVVRTSNALIFTDGFERGSSNSWNGN